MMDALVAKALNVHRCVSLLPTVGKPRNNIQAVIHFFHGETQSATKESGLFGERLVAAPLGSTDLRQTSRRSWK